MTTTTLPLHANGHRAPAPTLPALAPDVQAICRKRYGEMRTSLVKSMPAFGPLLPAEWPSTTAGLDGNATIQSLRAVTATCNEGLLILGFGDGLVLDVLRQDPVARAKNINLIIYDAEMPAFAHSLGFLDMQPILQALRLGLHYIKNADDLACVVVQIFGDHGEIAQLAGTSILNTHPLIASGEALRTELAPVLTKLLIERYDCLGNDVYDTFLGAKHAINHGAALVRLTRSSDYLDRYAGKSALCIASGPSCAAHFEKIRAIQHEHVVICADSILCGLLDAGIEPDFTCMVERPDTMHRLIDGHAERSRTVMVALPVVHPSSVRPFGDRVCWYWNGDDLYPWLDPKEQRLASGRSAGTLTAAFAAHLGVKTAYLVGHDLAYSNGASHSAGVAPMALETMVKVNKELSRDNPNYYRRRMDTPKNGGGMVETMGVWDIFRSDLQGLITIHRQRTSFINVNIEDGIGAFIAHALPGRLPDPTGTVLEKSVPTRTCTEEEIAEFRARCLTLLEDFTSFKESLMKFAAEMAEWKPLSHSRNEIEAMAARISVVDLVSKDNRAWFAYVFRAALRNLMVRLHQNTFVRTMAERNWNQVQVMRLYLQAVPELIDRLRPELEKALECWA